MTLPHQLVEAPLAHGDRTWHFALQGSQELSREGRWWTVPFPHRPKVFTWEELLRSSDVGAARCGEAVGKLRAGAMQKAGMDGFPVELLGEQAVKQHACFVPVPPHFI